MIREDIFRGLFKAAINQCHDLDDPEKNDLRLRLDYGLISGITDMLNSAKFNYLTHIFYYLSTSGIDLSEDVDYTAFTDYNVVEFENAHQKRGFTYTINGLYVTNVDCFSQELQPNVFMVLEALAFDVNRYQDLLDMIEHPANNMYVTLWDAAQFNDSAFNLYSYAYLKFLEQNEIELDPDLIWEWASVTPVNISYSNQVTYSQYYDIYDVINEWHHSRDVLTAFLKMYQVLEYLGYRKKMVGIVAGAGTKNSFLMHVKALNANFNERVTLKDLFVNDLGSLKNRLSYITPTVSAFIRRYWPNSNGQPYLKPVDAGLQKDQINGKIANFVYDVRCAIVHNKESEFHITYTNVDEYRDLLPLMKEILALMPSMIMNCLNNPNAKIAYSAKELKLY